MITVLQSVHLEGLVAGKDDQAFYFDKFRIIQIVINESVV